MDSLFERVPVELESGRSIGIEISDLSGEVDVSSAYGLSFQEFADSIRDIAQSLGQAVESVKPDKATIEFGVEAGIESGKLTAILVNGTGKANLKITLEWDANRNISSNNEVI